MLKVELKNGSRVALTGRFDASQVLQAEAVLDGISGDCVIECQNLDYISSAGIGVILATYKRLHAEGATLRMIDANEHIRTVFRYAGLDKIISMDQA